ncbi:MAG TPA: cytochrome c4 [Steroidobacteraceae bacterium]|nr:cytochrome c4 [Steroidobacteraceae bacterium]
MSWTGALAALLLAPLAHAAGATTRAAAATATAPAATASATAPAAAVGAGSAEAGAAKAAICAACHGPSGNSTNPMWPALAGQNAAYIKAQLVYWHDKTRVDPSGVMPTQAANLSPQDIADLAAYFALQTPAGEEADPSYWQAGEKLYRGGDPSRNIPACMACHGPVGRGVPSAGYPQLRAQHAVYILAQLQQYASDTRYTRNSKGVSAGGPYDQIMHTIASRLTPEDMRDVASYVQGMR